MTDTELLEACKTRGVSYTEAEKEQLFAMFSDGSTLLAPVLLKRLLLTGCVGKKFLDKTDTSRLKATGFFSEDTQVMFMKKFSLYAVLEATGYSDDMYRFAACVYMVFLGVPAGFGARLDLRGDNFMEDLRMTFMRKASQELIAGAYGFVSSDTMSVQARRFMALWQVFAVDTYGGIPIERFFACFGERLFEGIKIEKLPLTNEKISQIIDRDITAGDYSASIRWVEENIK